MSEQMQKQQEKLAELHVEEQQEQQQFTELNAPLMKEEKEEPGVNFPQPVNVEAAAPAPVMEKQEKEKEVDAKEARAQKSAEKKKRAKEKRTRKKEEKEKRKQQKAYAKRMAHAKLDVDKTYQELITEHPDYVKMYAPTELYVTRSNGLLLSLLENMNDKPETLELIDKVQGLCSLCRMFEVQNKQFRIRQGAVPDYIEEKTGHKVSRDIKALLNYEDTMNNNMPMSMANTFQDIYSQVMKYISKDKQMKVHKSADEYADRAELEMQRLQQEHPDMNTSELTREMIREKLNENAGNPV